MEDTPLHAIKSTAAEQPRYREVKLTLRPLRNDHGVQPIPSLRAALKALRRCYFWKVVRMEGVLLEEQRECPF
jgi:hypothetical protein